MVLAVVFVACVVVISVVIRIIAVTFVAIVTNKNASPIFIVLGLNPQIWGCARNVKIGLAFFFGMT